MNIRSTTSTTPAFPIVARVRIGRRMPPVSMIGAVIGTVMVALASGAEARAHDGAANATGGASEAIDETTAWNAPRALRRVRTGGLAAPLPEGIVLLRTEGELRPGPKEQSWIFEPDEPTGAPRRSIPVLPSAAMEHAAARLDAMDSPARLRVELTGTVTLHRGQNFILTAMVTPLEAVERGGVPSDRAPDADAAEADEIERRLRERLGAIPRGSDLPDRAITESDGVVEGRMLRRRGTIRRDTVTGGWRFVPETEHGGAPEPTMGLLPNRTLERLERIARLIDTPRPLLVTGEVVRFRDRVFLLPTAIEAARTGRSLRPGGAVPPERTTSGGAATIESGGGSESNSAPSGNPERE